MLSTVPDHLVAFYEYALYPIGLEHVPERSSLLSQ
jgi:hypothetical protein